MSEFKENIPFTNSLYSMKSEVYLKIKEKDDEISNLKNEVKIIKNRNKLSFKLRNRVNESNKNKALLQQKIDLLEKQIEESKLRENNLKTMNENIMIALKEISFDKKSNSNCKVIFFFIKDK